MSEVQETIEKCKELKAMATEVLPLYTDSFAQIKARFQNQDKAIKKTLALVEETIYGEDDSNVSRENLLSGISNMCNITKQDLMKMFEYGSALGAIKMLEDMQHIKPAVLINSGFRSDTDFYGKYTEAVQDAFAKELPCATVTPIDSTGELKIDFVDCVA